MQEINLNMRENQTQTEPLSTWGRVKVMELITKDKPGRNIKSLADK